MDAFKGFDKDLRCRGYQYEIGSEYEEKEASLCRTGFHACQYPIDCFSYYPPASSRFCDVEIEDNGERTENDTKVCGRKIKIHSELDITDLYFAAFRYVQESGGCVYRDDRDALVLKSNHAARAENISALVGGDRSTLSAGWGCALVGGRNAAIRAENCSALATGDCGVLIASELSALSAGDQSMLKAGDCSALVSDYKSSLKAGDGSALVGGMEAMVYGGDNCALIAGAGSELSAGRKSVIYGGCGAKVRAGKDSVLALPYIKDGEYKGLRVKVVDDEKIKADTWYKLDKAGRFIKAKD